MSLENMVQVRSSATREEKHGVLETERPRFPSLHLDSCQLCEATVLCESQFSCLYHGDNFVFKVSMKNKLMCVTSARTQHLIHSRHSKKTWRQPCPSANPQGHNHQELKIWKGSWNSAYAFIHIVDLTDVFKQKLLNFFHYWEDIEGFEHRNGM